MPHRHPLPPAGPSPRAVSTATPPRQVKSQDTMVNYLRSGQPAGVRLPRNGGPMRSVLVTLAALMIIVAGCGERGARGLPWSGTVHAEVDDLTGARTGLFRTYGPTQPLIAGPETIPVTAGYWCQVDDDSEPAVVTDGLFFRVAMPDTSLVSDDREAFEELSGQLGLLDVARLAVDGRVYAWEYEPRPKAGEWFLDGAMGFEPPREFDTEREREELLQSLAGVPSTVIETMGEAWPIAHDYVASHYVGRDTVGIELKRVLTFSLQGFAAAKDSVRFWCPLPQSHHEWNTTRVAYLNTWDSLLAAALQQDSISARFLTATGLLRPTRGIHAEIPAAELIPDFIEYARENGVYPLRSYDDIDRVCYIWTRSLTQMRRDSRRDAMRTGCDNNVFRR